MKKDIKNHNKKGQTHGYQQWYSLTSNKLWYRAIYKNNKHVGYSEWHGTQETIFSII